MKRSGPRKPKSLKTEGREGWDYFDMKMPGGKSSVKNCPSSGPKSVSSGTSCRCSKEKK